MKSSRKDSETFTLEFESEQELRDEYSLNLSQGALLVPTSDAVPMHTSLTITLRGPWGGGAEVRGIVVSALPDGLAVAITEGADELLDELLARPDEGVEPEESSTDTRKQNAWDRVRSLSQTEKILLAVKAGRTDRTVLLQENDPRILLSLLRNPRITVDEVGRLSRSAFLNYQIAEVIMKSAQWSGNMQVRIGMIHNPKTPQAFALRILPTLPDNEVRAVARAGTSMALKQAALRLLQGKR